MTMNDKAGWGGLSKAVHWASAAVILVLLGHGWRMTELAPRASRYAHNTSHAHVAGAIYLWQEKDGVMEGLLPGRTPASTALR